jgi:hypothetical protein
MGPSAQAGQRWDNAALTGESVPVEAGVGDPVYDPAGPGGRGSWRCSARWP